MHRKFTKTVPIYRRAARIKTAAFPGAGLSQSRRCLRTAALVICCLRCPRCLRGAVGGKGPSVPMDRDRHRAFPGCRGFPRLQFVAAVPAIRADAILPPQCPCRRDVRAIPVPRRRIVGGCGFPAAGTVSGRPCRRRTDCAGLSLRCVSRRPGGYGGIRRGRGKIPRARVVVKPRPDSSDCCPRRVPLCRPRGYFQ